MSRRLTLLLTTARLSCACLASAAAFASNGIAPGALAPSAGNSAAGQSNLLTAWSDLWRTPDQQGQALLDAGEPAQAAERFHDPRRRAYADLEAGRYPEAAKLLEPFTDADSEYNRGNALAKAGQLQAALAAYDAALKQAPADKDIRRNRDLVERALRQQHQSPQSSAGNGKQERQSSGSARQGQQAGQSAAGQPDGGTSAKSQAQAGSGNRQQSGASGSPSAADGQLASNGAGNRSNPDSGAPQSMTGENSGAQNEKAGQAQRDAAEAAALARQQQQRGQLGTASQAPGHSQNGAPQSSESAQTGARKQSGAQSLIAGGTQSPKQKPETERQLALDQWLRQIPDSPAGLLQRKFLIEHMMRQQDSGDPQGDGP